MDKIVPHPKNPNHPLTYDKPKALCSCGHTGDGPDSDHEPTEFGTKGHGKCSKCTCVQFRWAGWTRAYAKVLSVLRAQKP